MNIAYLLLGTNLGNKSNNLAIASQKISLDCGNIIIRSNIYETSPWGVTDQPVFYNQVIKLETENTAQKLLEIILLIELGMGRARELKWGERVIDIDILYFNNEIINDQNLSIPHPEIPNRKFTLVPLCELAADYKHPFLNVSNQQLLYACKDSGIVTKITTL